MFQQLSANALAASALVVALTGTSLAIAGLPHNSVGSKQIKKAAVHKSDIHAHAVTSSKLGAGVLRMEGFATPTINGVTPSNTPDATLTSQVITTTKSGRIFGFGRGSYGVLCVFAQSTIRAALYLDGAPLVGSGAQLPTAAEQVELNLFGMTAAPVAPGKHTLALMSDCDTGSPSIPVAGGDIALGAMVLHD